MDDREPTAAHQPPGVDQPAARPLISSQIAALPAALRDQVALLSEPEQVEFLRAFRSRSTNLALAYLCSLVYCHYGLLGRWTMVGWMWVSLFWASTLGLIWWLIDLVRLPGMVRAHNQQVAAEILGKLGVAPSDP